VKHVRFNLDQLRRLRANEIMRADSTTTEQAPRDMERSGARDVDERRADEREGLRWQIGQHRR
jgi:hypothetical protein